MFDFNEMSKHMIWKKKKQKSILYALTMFATASDALQLIWEKKTKYVYGIHQLEMVVEENMSSHETYPANQTDECFTSI